MITRRDFFGIISGTLVLFPFLEFPRKERQDPISYPYSYFYRYYNSATGNYSDPDPHIFQCGSGEMGTLYWSKENHA